MALSTFSGRLRIASMKADRQRRALISKLMYSPAFRWRFGSASAEQLLIVPQDLRSNDPSFWLEVQQEQFGLAGMLAELNGHSPFDIVPPNRDWERALHGFGWLGNLKAAGEDGAQETARRLAVEWTIRHGRRSRVAWDPGIAGRRLIAWLTFANFLLEDADAETYDAITRALGTDIVRLSASWRDGADGYPRLLALTALVLSGLCVAGHEAQLAENEKLLAMEVSRQILSDGGHVSRNPATIVNILLDFLPLKQCFAARGRALPTPIGPAINGMLSMLRHVRLGDGMLARFNGMSVAAPAELATVLAYDEMASGPEAFRRASKFVRMERGRTIVIVDGGGPPPLALASDAHAGCLSFEMSSGTSLILTNGGAPGSADRDWRAIARATVSHNTLVLGEQSSSKLVRDPVVEELLGSSPIEGPTKIQVALEEQAGALELSANHDGYYGRFGLIHSRQLVLSGTGLRLLGIDRVAAPRGTVRLRKDLPFSIHFHVHPDAECRASSSQRGAADILLGNGQTWRFTAPNSAMSIEESMHYADSAGPRPSLQIVVRGATFGETEVRWVLECVSGDIT